MADCVCVCVCTVYFGATISTSAAISRNSPTSGGSGGIVQEHLKTPPTTSNQRARRPATNFCVLSFLIIFI